MVVLSTPSFALWLSICWRLSSMREDNGAERPGMGNRRKARMASAMGSRRVFFITA